MKGHNSALTDNERKSLIFYHFRKIKAQRDVVDSANDELKRLKGLAKADGITLGDIDHMMRIANTDDPTIVADELRRWTELATWMAIPVQFQPDLFEDKTSSIERAEAEGEVAGLKSENGGPPYDEESREAAAWVKGWKKGQKYLGKSLDSALAKANSAAENEDGEGE